jgi:site-specific recombinase XerD
VKNISRTRYGFRAYVKVGTLQDEKRFKPDTPIKTMRDWVDEARVALRKLPQSPGKKDTFRADGQRYLALEEIKRLLSFKSRRCEIQAWYPHIGDIPREKVARAHMLDARSSWLAAGIAPKTINHRVRALRHLYRLFDGSKAPTPADDLERLKEPDANPQFVPVQTIRRVAGKITDPKTRARFMVLTATGMRPAQLRRAVRLDVDLRRRLWKVRPAKGGNPIPMVLTRDMVAAWKAFIAADAWGLFDGSDYARALYAAGWPKGIRPYNAKHTVALTLANSDAEWEDIKDFFGHTDIKTTKIYTGMVLGRLKGTASKLEGRLGWK